MRQQSRKEYMIENATDALGESRLIIPAPDVSIENALILQGEARYGTDAKGSTTPPRVSPATHISLPRDSVET
jgi:hypothetical protein